MSGQIIRFYIKRGTEICILISKFKRQSPADADRNVRQSEKYLVWKWIFIISEGRQMPSKGNINIVHDEQIWRDHIRTGKFWITRSYLFIKSRRKWRQRRHTQRFLLFGTVILNSSCKTKSKRNFSKTTLSSTCLH